MQRIQKRTADPSVVRQTFLRNGIAEGRPRDDNQSRGGLEFALARVRCCPEDLVYENTKMRGSRTYFVYIVSSRSRNIYTGVTNDLERRISQHKQGSITRIHEALSNPSARILGGIWRYPCSYRAGEGGQALQPKKAPSANRYAKSHMEGFGGIPVSRPKGLTDVCRRCLNTC